MSPPRGKIVKLQALKPPRFPWFDYSRYSSSLGLKANGHTILSGHSASEYDAQAVVKGGMAQQTRTAWAKIATILEAGGQSLADVVRVVEYVTPAGIERYAEAAQAGAEAFGTNRPAVNTVVVKSLLRPQALIEIEVIAGPGESPTAQGSVPQSWPAARATDGLVYLSSVLPLDEAGAVVAPGDVTAQTGFIFACAARILATFGLGMTDIVKTVDYLVPAALPAYKGTAQVRRDHFAPVFPAATGIVMPRVAHSDAMIQVDFIASRSPRAAINPGWNSYAQLTYSPGIRAGKMIFVSGHAAIDPNAGRAVYAGNVVEQAEYVYGKVLQVIAAAGGSAENLVKTIEYVTPAALPRYREVAGIRTRMLQDPLPASTGVVCETLLRPEYQIEVDSVAILD
jgi:enamine deaminase RidA (YjgF/YER057c/UK114 family)